MKRIELGQNEMIGLALGTLNAGVLLLLLVLQFHLGDGLANLLDDLNTLLGLALFALLWLVTCFCSYRGWKEAGVHVARPIPVGKALRSCIFWGAWNGALFFAVIAGAVLVYAIGSAIVDGRAETLLAVIAFGVSAVAAGSVIAGVVGLILGLLFGALDLVLLLLARSLVSPLAARSPDSKTIGGS